MTDLANAILQAAAAENVNLCSGVIYWTPSNLARHRWSEAPAIRKSSRGDLPAQFRTHRSRQASDCRTIAFYEYTPFCNGPGDVKSPRVIVTPPSSRFCPWLALRPPHYAVRRNGEPI